MALFSLRFCIVIVFFVSTFFLFRFCSNVLSGTIKKFFITLISINKVQVGSSSCCREKISIITLIKISVGIQRDTVFSVINFVVVFALITILIVIIALRQVGVALSVMFSVIGIYSINRKRSVIFVFQNKLVFISEKRVLLLRYSEVQVFRKLRVMLMRFQDCFGRVVVSLGMQILVTIVLSQVSAYAVRATRICQLVSILSVTESSKIVVMVEVFIKSLVFINLLFVVNSSRISYFVGEQVVVLIFISVQSRNGLILKQILVAFSSFRSLVNIIIRFLAKLFVICSINGVKRM